MAFPVTARQSLVDQTQHPVLKHFSGLQTAGCVDWEISRAANFGVKHLQHPKMDP
jgi:hypothetical protein